VNWWQNSFGASSTTRAAMTLPVASRDNESLPLSIRSPERCTRTRCSLFSPTPIKIDTPPTPTLYTNTILLHAKPASPPTVIHHRRCFRANIPSTDPVNSSLAVPTPTRSPCCARPPRSIGPTTTSTSKHRHRPLKTSTSQQAWRLQPSRRRKARERP